MAANPHFRLAARNSMLNQINTSLGGSAVMIIYSGTQPSDASVAITTQVAIASLAFTQSSAFAQATAGAITANAITSDSSAVGGTASWFSIVQSNGTTRVADGSVDVSNADCILNSVTITTGATVAITSFQITLAA